MHKLVVAKHHHAEQRICVSSNATMTPALALGCRSRGADMSPLVRWCFTTIVINVVVSTVSLAIIRGFSCGIITTSLAFGFCLC